MQHAVSYQPTAPVRASRTSSRLSSLFSKGLRKSSSARDLIDDSRTPREMRGGGGSKEAGLSGGSYSASASSEGGGVDASFIPYHGPISPPPPPPTLSGLTPSQHSSSSTATKFVDEHSSREGHITTTTTSLPAPNVGPAFGRGQFERSFMFPKHSEAVDGKGRGPYGRAAGKRGSPNVGEATEEKSGLLVGLGLSSQQQQQQQQQQQDQVSPNSHSTAHQLEANERLTRFFEASKQVTLPGYGLPTAYVHGGNTPKLPDSPSMPSGGGALPSLMRVDYREAAPLQQQQQQPPTREAVLRNPEAVFAYRRGSSSTSVADVSGAASTYTPNRTGTANSISSNEGGSAGETTMSSAGMQSASTSMTSLRAPSQAAGSATQQHVQWPSNTAAGTASTRSASSQRRNFSSASTPDLRKLNTEFAPSSARAIPAQTRIPPPRWQDVPQVATTAQRTPWPSTIWQAGAPLLSPIAASTRDSASPIGTSPSSRGFAATPVQRSVEAPDTTQTQEAWRRYNLLQQLHLDEVAAHAPEATGFLDADNGCERILMPRPRLRSRASVDATFAAGEAEAAFERNRPAASRRAKAESNPDVQARTRAHERMARVIAQAPLPVTAYDFTHQQAKFGGAQPFFHHRMPPAPPVHLSAHEEDIPTRCTPHSIPRSTGRQRSSVQPLRFPASPSGAEFLLTPPTPGLSPGFSDVFGDEALTPDLETVLAEGAALERHRAQWRRQHARSFGGAEGLLRGKSRSRERERRGSTGSKRKAGQWNISEPMPISAENAYHTAQPLALPQQQHQASALRHSRSSPQLGQINRRDFGADSSRPATPPSPNVPTSFLPFFGGGAGHRRALSKDSGVDQAHSEGKWKGMFKKKRSRASTSATTSGRLSPTREREQLHAASLATQRRMRSSQSWDNAMTSGSFRSPVHLQANSRRTSWRQSTVLRGRFTPVPVDDARGDELNGRGKAALVSDEPVVIGRGFEAARGETAFRFPPNAEGAKARPDSQLTTGSGQYGFAISTPRPQLGAGTEPAPPQLAQGRHATSTSYHRPSNSADLKALLATSLAAAAAGEGAKGSRSSFGSSTRTQDSRRDSITTPKRSSSLGRQAAAEIRQAMTATASSTSPSGSSSRRNSLGMSSASRHGPPPLIQKPDLLDELQSPPQSVGQSLPVPPRKPRLSGVTTSAQHLARPTPPSSNKTPAAPFSTPFSDSTGFEAGASLSSALSPSPSAFFTPPLGVTPLTPAGTSYFAAAASSPALATAAPTTPEATPRAPQHETPAIPSHLDVDSPPALPDGPSPVPSSALGSDEMTDAVVTRRSESGVWRRRVGHSSSSDSSMSQRSTAVRELWTTDDHQEESFSGLFVRRPSATGSGSEGSSLSRERIRAVSLASSGEMDPAPPGDLPASPRDVGTPKSQTSRREAVLKEARNAAASYRTAMQAHPHAQPESAVMGTDAEEELSPALSLAPAFVEKTGSQKSTAASRLGRMGAELQAATQLQASPNPSEAISSTLVHGSSGSAAPSAQTHTKQVSTPGLVAASFIDFDQGLSGGEEGRQDTSATSSMLGVPAAWGKTSGDSTSGSEALDSSGEQRRRSNESGASAGFASLVKPRVWPEPPKSPGNF